MLAALPTQTDGPMGQIGKCSTPPSASLTCPAPHSTSRNSSLSSSKPPQTASLDSSAFPSLPASPTEPCPAFGPAFAKSSSEDSTSSLSLEAMLELLALQRQQSRKSCELYMADMERHMFALQHAVASPRRSYDGNCHSQIEERSASASISRADAWSDAEALLQHRSDCRRGRSHRRSADYGSKGPAPGGPRISSRLRSSSRGAGYRCRLDLPCAEGPLGLAAASAGPPPREKQAGLNCHCSADSLRSQPKHSLSCLLERRARRRGAEQDRNRSASFPVGSRSGDR